MGHAAKTTGAVRCRRIVGPCLAVLLVVPCCGITLLSGRPQGGQQTQSDPVSGLSVTYDQRWQYGAGYWPVVITVKPTIPSAADRTLRFEEVWGAYGSRDGLSAKQDLKIPAGSGAVQTTLLMPYFPMQTGFRFEVYEDGVVVPALSLQGSYNWGSQTHSPTILLIGESQPNTDRLRASFNRLPHHYGGASDIPLTRYSPDDLPSEWLSYTNLDIVCLSLNELDRLYQRRPAAHRALLDWVAAGGNLWVYGVGDHWQGTARLDKLVGLPASLDNAKDASGWAPLKADNTFESLPIRGGMRMSLDKQVPPQQLPTAFAQFQVQKRPLQLGLVIALDREDVFPGLEQDWALLLGDMGRSRLDWCQRHGIAVNQPNADFWNFLVPGVGLAPVTEFCILITLFVIVIGPVNYLLLRRWKRLHLLVLTVPAITIVSTAAMFGYAVFADGFGVRTRVRSVTDIDQQSGRCVSWSRLSYYSGLTPSDGLRFSKETAVFPMMPVPPTYRDSRQSSRELVWSGDQHLSRGWLAARTPTQFIAVRAHHARQGLDLIESTEGKGNRPAVRNRWATRIHQLVVRSRGGQYYWAHDVAEDGQATLEPIEPGEAAKRLQATELPTRPTLLPGTEKIAAFYDQDFKGQIGARLELELSQWVISGNGVDTLRPGSYLAVVDRPPHIEVGIEKAKEEKGYHLIHGTW